MKNKVIMSQGEQLKKIKKRVIIVVVFAVVALLVSSVVNSMVNSTYNDELEVTNALNQYSTASNALTQYMQAYATTGEVDYYNDYMRELNTDKNREKALEILKNHELTEEEWDAFDRIADLSAHLAEHEEKAIAYVKAEDTIAAMAEVFSHEYEDTVKAIDTLMESEISDVQERMAVKVSVMIGIQGVAQVGLLVAIILLTRLLITAVRFANTELLVPIQKTSDQMVELAAGNFNAEFEVEENETEVGRMAASIITMKKNTSEIISEVSDILEHMADGNYDFKVSKDYVGDYGRIEESFGIIRDKMTNTINTLKNASEQINVGAEQLSGAAQDLAEGCTSQANQVSAVVDAIKAMSDNMEDNARKAIDTVQLSTQAGATLMEGNRKMEELIAAIGEISRCSEQIRTIIGAIEDIASQTNLLSLNAAIEAARAGEAGRGFAVVADQVKKLAEESSEAAGRTTELIESTVQAVEKGIAIANETAEDMVMVMGSAKEATEKMNNIAELLSEEVANVQEVNATMVTISEVVNNNSASSEETAAVSEEQMAQVETMVQMISQFRI